MTAIYHSVKMVVIWQICCNVYPIMLYIELGINLC